MAKVRIEEIVQYLDFYIEKSLEEAVRKTMPGTEPDKNSLFREFRDALARNCPRAQDVPDHCIELDPRQPQRGGLL